MTPSSASRKLQRNTKTQTHGPQVWLWLEEKRVPYRVEKVTMFCYGQKEPWYTRLVPSGMLPAIKLDGKLITESDEILMALEKEFGPLYKHMNNKSVVSLRQLERVLFRSWCEWACYPARSPEEDHMLRANFKRIVRTVEEALGATPGPYFLEDFSVVDVVFTPYIERMNASLFYYKGYTLRDRVNNPRISAWFDAMEIRETYRGTQSDFHTHCHDLPPQMGTFFYFKHWLPFSCEFVHMQSAALWLVSCCGRGSASSLTFPSAYSLSSSQAVCTKMANLSSR